MPDKPLDTYWKGVAENAVWRERPKISPDLIVRIMDSLKKAYDKGAEDTLADISAKIDAIAELDDLP